MKKLLDCSDEELVAFAQTILNKYNKALADAKAIAEEYGFEVSESENKLLNIIFAKLKERRDAVTKESVEPAFKVALEKLSKRGEFVLMTELIALFQENKLKEVQSKLQELNFNHENVVKKTYTPKDPNAAKELIKVTFPDGRVICHNRVVKTLIDVIEYAGVENVASLNISVTSQPLVSRNKYPQRQNEIKGGWLVTTCSNTPTKKKQIEQISNALQLGLIIEDVAEI